MDRHVSSEAASRSTTQAVYERARSELLGSRAKAYELKGFDGPIELYTA